MPLRGLTVGAQGQLLRDGQRFRNIGLNYGGAIVRIYTQPSATACEYTPGAEQDAILDQCVAMGVRVLRVKATPYWPAQWRYGVNNGIAGVAATAADREAYYARIDSFLEKCRSRGIGVILTLFFRHASASDLAGQTVRAGWLTAGSATRTFVQAVTQEIVTRYLNEDAVYGYEWSNEVNHYNDATDAALGSFPGVNTGYGSRSSYPAADTAFRGNELSDVVAWWYGIVRAIDNQRIVLTGNGPNTYTLESGVAGIPWPLFEWYRQQVRDNPTNCGSIHWYGNVGYGSPGFRGLDPILTGARHSQRLAGRGFVLGEFGGQPWRVTAVSGDGSTVSVTCDASCPIEAGEDFQLVGINPTFNGAYTVKTINAARTSITADAAATGEWTGSVRGLQFMGYARVSRMCRDIIASGTDVALFWMIDNDAGAPLLESVLAAGNEGVRQAITEANLSLG